MKGVAPFAEPVDGAKPAPSSDPIALLNFALQNARSAVHLIDFARAIKFCTRETDPCPDGPYEPYVAMSAPQSVLDNLTGPDGERDAYVLIHIERSAVDAMDEPWLNLILPPGMRRSF